MIHFTFKLGLVILALGTSIQASAQYLSPGGVDAPVVWHVAKEAHGQTSWVDKLTGEATPAHASCDSTLNFNKTIRLSPDGYCLRSEVSVTDATIFVVYQADAHDQEEVVWQTVRNDTTEWILTTARMADLRSGYYLTIADQRPHDPKQYCYVHKSENGEESAAIDFLCLGNTNTEPRLPVSSLNGTIAEFIVYDRVLSAEERTRVESYLAIKFGTMLSGPGPAIYRSASGKELWNGYQYVQFSHRIAGLGRDDASGLSQVASTSSYDPGFIIVACEEGALNTTDNSSLSDGTFLLWGDNNGAIDTWAQVRQSALQKLARHWLVAGRGDMHKVPVSLSIDRTRLPKQTSDQKTFWLMIDRTGNGDFHPRSTDLIQGTVDNTVIVFDSVSFDEDRSDSDLFTIATADDIGFLLNIDRPSCVTGTAGKFQYKIFAGTPPYTVSITAPDGSASRKTIAESALQEEHASMVGTYALEVTDAHYRVYKASFIIDHFDGPKACIEDQYFLISGEEITLTNTCSERNTLTSWMHEGKTIGSGPEIMIRKPGSYVLEVVDNGCMTRKTVLVTSALSSAFQSYTLYPNPVTIHDPVQLEIILTKRSAMTLTIADVYGRTFSATRFEPDTHFSFSQEVQLSAGIYYCTLEAQGDILTIPFIVQ